MSAKERAVAWAAGIVADAAAIFLDTETLGKDPCAGLCDLAVVAIDGTVIFDCLINPGRPIPAGATAVHGIRDADVAFAPTWRDVYPDVRAVLTGRTAVVYNAGFDAAVLDCCCDEAELPALGGATWQCAMKAYSDFDGTRSTNPRRPGMKWWKLGEACAAMGVVLDGAHRALADAQACRQLVLAMANFATGVAPVQAGLPLGDAPGLRRPSGRDWTE